MIKTGCEVIYMTWDFYAIMSVGVLKNFIPNLEIKFVDEFSNNPRTWKINLDKNFEPNSYAIYCDICDRYQTDDDDKYSFLSATVGNDKIKNIIDDIKPETSVAAIWKEAFLYAVELAYTYIKAKNFNLSIYHSCISWFDYAKDGYVFIEDEDSPWEEIAKDYPDVKFAIIDTGNSYDHEKSRKIADGFVISSPYYIDLRYKVKPIVVNQRYRIPVFRDESKIILASYPNTERYSVMEPNKSWESFSRVDEVSFEHLNDAIDFVKEMIRKYDDRKKGVN